LIKVGRIAGFFGGKGLDRDLVMRGRGEEEIGEQGKEEILLKNHWE